ncbi:cyclin [Apiospora phragmitis]|uniref:Cyclin n=1 Tax=Apiospora phragmitis TaxID=2905665 RepID=A0ABR1VZC8_9PEZI
MSSAISTIARPFVPPYLPSPVGYPQSRRLVPPPLSLKKVQETSVADEAALYSGGLRTPPAEDGMGTTYHHNPVLSSTYDSHVALARQPNGLVQASRPSMVLCDATLNQFSMSQAQHQQQQQQQQQQQPLPHQHHYQTAPQHHQQNLPHLPQPSQQPHHASAVASVPTCHSGASHHSTRPSTPSSTRSSYAHSEGGTVSRRESTMVMHSLRLPTCISSNGGNLDDYAALMTCFFWFENMETIQAAEGVKDRNPNAPIPPLSSYTRPDRAYKKWVNTILSTTQVTQNVILLALLFVYRLKSTNPKVNGSPGSEYRLLTVALMLGNKFLDDNTYTNKTWAEVSGIAVKEIHVMEVEFLSNMRYGLLTSKEQWAEWLDKLACFHEYCEKAELAERAAELAAARRAMQPNLPSPTHRNFASPLPSPTSILPTSVVPSSMQCTPASVPAYSPSAAIYNTNQSWSGQFQPTPAMSPLAAKPSLSFNGTRKRSVESTELSEPAPKRINRQSVVSMPPHARQLPNGGIDPARLPVPHLTLDTSQTTPAAYVPPPNYSQGPVSLPPLGAGVRAMATVYPNATTWAPQAPLMATCGPQTPAYTAPSNYGTPTKRTSPRGLNVYGSSPLTESYAGHHTPMSNSPSVYLQQRNSPYKPLRPVNTLNYPPPSIPLPSTIWALLRCTISHWAAATTSALGLCPSSCLVTAVDDQPLCQRPTLSTIIIHD